MRLTVLASGSKGNSAVLSSARTSILVDCGLSCREILRRMSAAGEDPGRLSAILITHEHQDHVAGLGVLARKLRIPVFFTEPTHRAWVRMLTPRTTMTYAQWLDRLAVEREEKARADRAAAAVPRYAPLPDPVQDPVPDPVPVLPAAGSGAADAAVWESLAAVSAEAAALEHRPDPPAVETACLPETPADELSAATKGSSAATKTDPTYLPAVEYFHSGRPFAIGDIDVCPFTIPHDAADPCGFVFSNMGVRFGLATDLGYMPPNVKSALRDVDLLFLESNHDLDMLRDGPYPWSVKQRVLSRVGHLSNLACADFLQNEYDGGAHTIVLAHLSESNNVPALARIAAEEAVGDRMRLLGNRIVLAEQDAALAPIEI